MTLSPPAELTSFVGRRFELSEARRLLGSTRLLTVVGHGGVGKTRLAARLADQVSRSFLDGVVWVELAALTDPASIAGVVAGAAGVDPADRPAGEVVLAHLASHELLLVLDNCEHLVDACCELVSSWLFEAPRLTILATSRQPLRVAGEQLMCLEPLALPTTEDVIRGRLSQVEAVALLDERGKAVDPTFSVDAENAELVSRLCHRLDGIPLAIELAAARLRFLSVRQLMDRLDERFELLSTGLRSAPPRHQTLRGLVQWSHDLCSPAEQGLWAQASVFDGGADLEAIEAVCELSGSTIEVVAGLVDKSVLTTSQHGSRVRYQMLESIREYGAERLAERADADDVRRRHCDHFCTFAQEVVSARFGRGHELAVARTRGDLGNLRAAFEHSLADEADRSSALTIIASLQWFWPYAGLMEEGARWTERALAGEFADSAALLPALTSAAYLAGQRQDHDTMLPLARRAAELPVLETTPAERAARHLARGLLANVEERHEDALAEHLTALSEYASAGDLGRQVDELQNVALRMGYLGRAEEALSHLDIALNLCEQYGDRYERFWTLSVYTNILTLLGRHKEALALLAESLAEPQDVLSRGEPVDIDELIARNRTIIDDERRAAVLLGARARIFEDAGYVPGRYSRGGYAAMQHRLSSALGETAFREAYDEGFALPRSSIGDYAIGDLTSSPPEPVDRPRLSRREGEVAALIAEGLSNREVAGRMVISVRTAEGHVARIMDKLGFSSRAQIAGWAAREAVHGDGPSP